MQRPRKKPRRRPLLARICTPHDISEAKGGGLHDTIVRSAAAEDAQAAVEYAVILALVASVVIAGYQLLGTTVHGLVEAVVNAF